MERKIKMISKLLLFILVISLYFSSFAMAKEKTYQWDLSFTINNNKDYTPFRVAFGIMIPYQFEVMDVTYDGGKFGSGTLIDQTEEAGAIFALFYNDKHPVLKGYNWFVGYTSSTIDLDGMGGEIEIHFIINIKVDLSELSKGVNYSYSDAMGATNDDWSSYWLQPAETAGWDHPMPIVYPEKIPFFDIPNTGITDIPSPSF